MPESEREPEQVIAQANRTLDSALHLLRRDSPEAVLHAISQGDPFGLFDRCARELRARAYLLDSERLRDHTLAIIALTASEAPGSGLFQWIGTRIDEALDDLLQSDLKESRAGDPLDEADPRFWFLIETLGVEPEKTREASVAFNGLPAECRQAFFALVIEGRRVGDCVKEGMATQEELIQRTRIALAALLDMPSLLRLNERSGGAESRQ